MRDVLIVVDMQKDFIDGALGTAEAVAIVPNVAKKVRDFKGDVIFTRDTHFENYMDTQEGHNLPVPHCIRETEGWQICKELQPFAENAPIIDKTTFGSMELGPILQDMHEDGAISSITFVGLCTDICVISNVMIAKAFLPEVPIIVDAACCAGVTPDSHNTALASMRTCQVQVIND
jgi:nicotinamidase-related amidase